MNIAYVINGLNGGGAAFPMIQLLGLMRELGHEAKVLALSLQDGKAAARLESAGIPFEVLGGTAGVFTSAARLFRRLRAERPDLVWTSLTQGTLYGQLAGRLLDIPVVSWQHNDHLKPGNLALLRRTRSLTSRWIADSDAVRAFAQRELGVAADRIDVWAPFVADPDAPVSRPWTGPGRLRLGTLGRLHFNKQHSVLLHALARARDLDAKVFSGLELHVAGDGPQRPMLENLVRTLGLSERVVFAGFVSPQPFLAGLHGYVQASWKEGFCIAAHEAMQAALAVIATRVGQPAHSIRPGETGWLCEVGDVEAIAQAMLALARDPARASAMGKQARADVLERYSREHFRRTGERLVERIAREVTARQRRPDGRSAFPQPPAEP